MKITGENITSIAIGTQVVMNYGALYPIEEGLVVDYRILPATNLFPESYELVIENEKGEVHYTSHLIDKGGNAIGTYLKSAYMGVK